MIIYYATNNRLLLTDQRTPTRQLAYKASNFIRFQPVL